MESPQALGGKLLSRLVEIGTLFAKRLPAITSADIFALNVVAGIAVRIVVVNGLLDRVPWRFLRHCAPLVCGVFIEDEIHVCFLSKARQWV